jgi:sec-independent protein translocase protein TatB
MFDIGWSELVIIGIVALIVIGPKELPGVLRSMGHWVGKIRRMAGDFQGQFQEAMREADVADLKKQFDDAANAASGMTSGFDNPLETARRQMESALDDPKTDPAPSNTAAIEPPAETPSSSPAAAEAPSSQADTTPSPAAEATVAEASPPAAGEPEKEAKPSTGAKPRKPRAKRAEKSA